MSSHTLHAITTLGDQMTYTVLCRVPVEEGNAFHECTACTLMMEEGTLGGGAYDLLANAFHGQGEVHTCADGAALDSMTLAWANRLTVGVQEGDMTL